MQDIRIAAVTAPPDVRAARDLILEYAGTLPFDLGYQGFAEEIAAFPEKYAPPRGRLLLARVDGASAGCIALRPLGADDGEVKRLYVRPACRGLGLGRRLVEAIVTEGRDAGYRRLRLDTNRGLMAGAERLYRDAGFVETPPYYEGPDADTAYYALELRPD